MAMFNSSEDELDSFGGSVYVVERYYEDTEDKLDEDEDAVVDSGGTSDDGIYGNDRDFVLDGNNDRNFEGENNGFDIDSCIDGGLESKGCDTEEDNDDGVGEDSDGGGEDSDGGGEDSGDGGGEDSGDGGGEDSGDGGGEDSGDGGGVPARRAHGQCHPRQLLNVYLTRGGCCKDSCLMKYGDMPRVRALTLSRLDKKTRKAVVFGVLAVIRNKSDSRNIFQYRLDWSSPVCRGAFCAVIGTSYCTLKRWMQQLCSDSDVAPHAHGNCGRAPHSALSRLDKSRVVTFIRNYATINVLPDPGQLQGTIRDFVLESGKTMKSVYSEYCKAMESLSRSIPALQQPCPSRLTCRLKRQYSLLNVPPPSPTPPSVRAVKYVSFTGLWHRSCSNIKIQAARSDLCDKCDQWLVSLKHSLSNEQHKVINDRYNQHNTKAKAFRDSYNANIELAEKEWSDKRDEDREQILRCLESRTKLCLPLSHMPTWTCRCSTPLTTASRCLFRIAHSNGVQFISGHLARSRCLACVVSHCPARCSSSLTRHSRSARVLRWWSAWCMLSSTYMDWERGV